MNRTCVCVLFLTLPLAAQSPFRTTRHAGLPPITIGDKFAAGDIDGDGDIDLVVANDNWNNQLLLNDGRGRFSDATAARFPTHPSPNASHSVDLADIDGDGDLDVLFGNDDNLSNRVYRNNGAGFFTDATATALPANNFFTEHQVVADFDGDGDLDWFTADGGPCHFYRNNGQGVFNDASATALGNLGAIYGQRWSVTSRAADVDGDGDPHVLLPGPILLVNQGGVLTRPPSPLPISPSSFFEGNWFADIDSDGDQDILVNYGQVILQNRGNLVFVDVTATAFPSAHAAALACIDVDLDGDLDLVTSAVLWRNNGSGVFAAQAAATSVTGFHAPYNLGVAAADFDGDGDIDLPGRPNFLVQVEAVAAPVRGQTCTVSLHARPNHVLLPHVALAGSAIPLGQLGILRLDPLTAVPLGIVSVNTSPVPMPLSVPNLPGLSGAQLHFQALVIDPQINLHVSNAIGDAIQ